MNLDVFIAKWTGKTVDTDGVYPSQCMDLMHQYCFDVLGISDFKVLAQPYAYLVYQNFNNVFGHELFDKIDNTPTGVPQKGDIVFFNQNVSGVTGVAGHVSVFVEGDANSFKSFDSNYPTGSLPHIQDHTYRGVLGWLHYKGGNTKPMATITQEELDQIRNDRDTNYRNWQDEVKKNEDLINQIKDLNEKMQNILNDNKKLTEDREAEVQKESAIAEQLLEEQHETQPLKDTISKTKTALGYDDTLLNEKLPDVAKEIRDSKTKYLKPPKTFIDRIKFLIGLEVS